MDDGAACRGSLLLRDRLGEMALDATARSRWLWDRMAPRYDRDTRRLNRCCSAAALPSVCAQASGDVLDVAIGTGLNCRTTRPTCD